MPVRFTPQAAADIKGLPHLRKQIEKRVRELAAPGAAERLGKPLSGPLAGYRRIQIHGDHRLVYIVRDADVVVIALAHRKRVYGLVGRRVGP